VSTLLVALIIFWAYGMRGSKKELNDKIEKKADVCYVDSQNTKQDKRISEKADKSLVESMDSKLDLILDKLQNK